MAAWILSLAASAGVMLAACGWQSPTAQVAGAIPLPVLALDLNGQAISAAGRVGGEVRVAAPVDPAVPAVEPVVLRSRISIEVQGASTVTRPKRSYDVELLDDRGDERELSLFGLPPGTDWVLHGCGRDVTCLRNAFVYALARDFGRYAPRTQFVELVIDGKYHGLYVLVEKIRRDPDRVDLPRPAPNPADGDHSGGYIFKMDMGEGNPDDPVLRDWVSPVTQTIYSYHYPRFDRMTPSQKAYLQGYVSRFESMMAGPGWNDPATGYPAWLDVASWIDFALIQELANNPDGYSKSVYFQKWPESRGNRLAKGPVWDFDLSFGTVEFRDARRTDVWAHSANRFPGEPVPFNPPGRAARVPAYWERLWSDPAFRSAVHCRWRELRAGPLTIERVHARLDAYAREVAHAQRRDTEVWSGPSAEQYPGEVNSLKAWLERRIDWMDENLPGTCG